MRAQRVRGTTIGLVGFGRIAKGASFRSLGDVWANTTTPHGRLMLTVLGGLAGSSFGFGARKGVLGPWHAVCGSGDTPSCPTVTAKLVLIRRAAAEPQMATAQSYNVSSSTDCQSPRTGPKQTLRIGAQRRT
jgi:hypothetical protein